MNFGGIPVVGARILTFSLGLPQRVAVFGWEVDTYILLMALLLSLLLALTLSGGLITLMVTNCSEGRLSQGFFLIIIVALLWMFDWTKITQVLENQPVGKSLLDPFESMGLEDFNIWYVLIGLWGGIYRTMAWQNQSAYSTAATAHESRMGGILSNWKEMGNTAGIALLAVFAMICLAPPDFAGQAAGGDVTHPHAWGGASLFRTCLSH